MPCGASSLMLMDRFENMTRVKEVLFALLNFPSIEMLSDDIDSTSCKVFCTLTTPDNVNFHSNFDR